MEENDSDRRVELDTDAAPRIRQFALRLSLTLIVILLALIVFIGLP